VISHFENFIRSLTYRTAQAAQLAMVFAMLIIVANVILRIPWKPIGGTVELVEMAGAVLLALGVAYTALTRGHIMVGILVERFPPRVQGIVGIAVNSISLFFSFLLARELFLYALDMLEKGYQTGHLKIPLAPSIFLVSFGFFMLSAVILLDLVKAINSIRRGGSGR
jgi:TRAP-type C4-dicarboxylate transport system permease small subunit